MKQQALVRIPAIAIAGVLLGLLAGCGEVIHVGAARIDAAAGAAAALPPLDESVQVLQALPPGHPPLPGLQGVLPEGHPPVMLPPGHPPLPFEECPVAPAEVVPALGGTEPMLIST